MMGKKFWCEILTNFPKSVVNSSCCKIWSFQNFSPLRCIALVHPTGFFYRLDLTHLLNLNVRKIWHMLLGIIKLLYNTFVTWVQQKNFNWSLIVFQCKFKSREWCIDPNGPTLAAPMTFELQIIQNKDNQPN